MSADKKGAWVGAKFNRKEDYRLTTGKGRYLADLSVPGMVHMIFVRSDRAHAIIKSIDTSKAKALPGVITVVTGEDIKGMADKPIIFAMANPDPEIYPEEAAPYVRVMATGRSDYPNQINNALCFPGFFRGMLDVRASDVNSEMKMAAAKAIASAVPASELGEEYIMPSIFDRGVVRAVAREVASAA